MRLVLCDFGPKYVFRLSKNAFRCPKTCFGRPKFIFGVKKRVSGVEKRVLDAQNVFSVSKNAFWASKNTFWAGNLAVHVEQRNFRFRGWECDFRIPRAIPDRLMQVSFLYASSGVILGQNTFSCRKIMIF